jgi:hypothetical protein
MIETKIDTVYNRYTLMFFCVSVLMIFIAWIFGVNGLGPLDDHQMIRTIFQGKDFGFYIFTALGRFIPLVAQEYVVLSKIFSPSPALFYTFHASKLLLCGFLLYRCLVATNLENGAVFVLWCIVIFSVGIANTLFRLSAGEINLLIFMLVFVWSSQIVLEGKYNLSGALKKGVAILGILSLIVALFYKELAFVFGLVFGLSEFLRYYRNNKTKPPIFVFASTLIGATYIGWYGLWRHFYATGSYANFRSPSLISVLNNFAHSDPFLILVVLPITACRIFVIARNPAKHALHDSFLIAASAYVFSFLVLGMFNFYYLLPAYAFAVCGVAGVLRSIEQKIIRNIIIFVVLLCVINTLPITVSDIDRQKTTVNNHYQFVNYMADWLKSEKKANSQKRNLVLSGVSSGNGIEIISSLKTFLSSLGVSESLFDVKATEPSDNQVISSFYGSKDTLGYSTKINDVIIFNPYQWAFSPPPLQSPSFKEIYRSTREWTLPRWSGWDWVKYCALDYRNCLLNARASSCYSGYAAFLVVRLIETVPPEALKSPACRVEPLKISARLPSGISQILDVIVENTGLETWPAVGRLSDAMYVNLAYRWFDVSGRVVLEGSRVPFPEPIKSGDKVKVALLIKTPSRPGKFKLVISPVQEGVQWFKDGSGEGVKIDVY